MLREFVNSSNCPSNIMTSICSIVCTLPDTESKLGSIFFPPATCDLTTYIDSEANKPRSHAGRLRHIRQMLGVCQALEWLARNLTYKKDSDQFVAKTYDHCDLKPDNILVCHEYSATDDGALVFKISDFGQAREVQHVLQSDGNRRRQPPAGLALAGREGTYHAPEIQGQNTRLEIRADTASRKWDVWSFGCIFLLVIIFNYQGAEAIERFYQARRKQSPMGDDDCFCNPEARRSENVCNPAVTKHLNHYNYIESRAGNLELDDTITLESLKYLKKHILVRHGDRHDITNVSKKLHSIYNRRTPVGADITAHGYVPSDATHCGHSPDGTVFFYSPAKVVFYEDRRTFGAREILPLATESKWSGTVRPRSTSCARQSLCIVSESHGDFNVCPTFTDLS